MDEFPTDAVRRLNEWEDVPRRVVALYRGMVGPAFKVALALDVACGPGVRVFMHPEWLGAVHVHNPTWHDDEDGGLDKMASYERALPGFAVSYDSDPPFDPGWVLVKNSAFMETPSRAFDAAQAPLGGPNPLTSSIVGGLLGSGLGYGGGYLASRLGAAVGLVDEDDDRLARTGAVLGGVAGAAPGLAAGVRNMHMPAETGGGVSAWLSGYPHRPQDVGPALAPGQRVPFEPPQQGPGLLDSLTGWMGKRSAASLDDEVKAAFDAIAGAMYMPTIPVDAFNRAIWADVHRAPNPWGTRDAFGSGDAPMHTPPPVAAALSGIVAGAGAARDSDRVSAWDVASTAAVAAGTGYLGGLVLGKTLGALAGLRPEVQGRLQQAGLWGGLIAGAAGSLFGP